MGFLVWMEGDISCGGLEKEMELMVGSHGEGRAG